MSLFCNNTLRDSLQELGALIWRMENLTSMFCVHPSVGVEHFWVDLNGMTCFCAYPQCRSSVYVDGVYVILILRA
jgi:hypothetical protein